MATQGKTILVTGGAGFLGSHLCDRLLREGARVIGFDSLITGVRENVSVLEHKKNFVFIEGDITAHIPIQEAVHEIYNLASPASPVHYQRFPLETLRTNTIGVWNVLEFARAHGAKVLQASTSEIYGDPDIHPQTEEYRGNVDCIGPRACYDEGKRCAETLCFEYARVYGLAIGLVRIFNTYGPRMAVDDGRVVSNFISQALRREDVTLYGEGAQTRSFCYVTDMVDGLVRMMAYQGAGPINLGNPEETTIYDLAHTVLRITGSVSQIVSSGLPEGDPKKRKPDITKAKMLLAWSPEISLEDGLTRTVSYFNEKLRITS